MKPWMVLYTLAAAVTAMSGCASRDTRVFAQEKEYLPAASAQSWKIGGVFDRKEHTIVISFNGENVLRGRFPPYTPRLSAQARYNDMAVATLCKFSSDIIASKGAGWQERLAEAIVAKGMSTGGNSCDVTVDGKPAATLYF